MGGYIGINNQLDVSIAIRTIVYKDGHAYLQAGGGIVYDSNPEDEYWETVHKMGALNRAIDDTEDMLRAMIKAKSASDNNNNNNGDSKNLYSVRVPRQADGISELPQEWYSSTNSSKQVNDNVGNNQALVETAKLRVFKSINNNSNNPKRVLLLDNYDSFTYNVFQALVACGGDVVVLRHDKTTVEAISNYSYSSWNYSIFLFFITLFFILIISFSFLFLLFIFFYSFFLDALNPTHIVVSPGPNDPNDAGISNDLIRDTLGKRPLLGV